MQFLENEICEITQGVWKGFLAMSVARGPNSSSPSDGKDCLTGRVRFSGAWKGILLFQCPAVLARRAAAVMFNLDESSVTAENAQDTVAELTNMIGGNLKVVLPSPCRVGLPTATRQSLAPSNFPEDQLRAHLVFQHQDHAFSVTVLEGEEADFFPGSSESDRREFTRASAGFKVILTAKDKSLHCQGHLRDVSMTGIYCCCDSRDTVLPEGTECRATLLLGGPENFLRVEAEGWIARVTGNGMAMKFLELNQESYHHFRNLVLYNADSASQAESEIQDHLGIKQRQVVAGEPTSAGKQALGFRKR